MSEPTLTSDGGVMQMLSKPFADFVSLGQAWARPPAGWVNSVERDGETHYPLKPEFTAACVSVFINAWESLILCIAEQDVRTREIRYRPVRRDELPECEV